MAMIRKARAEEQRLQAMSALAMALFEQTGLRRLVDSRFKPNAKVKLTPGNAVKAMVGCMASAEGRRPMMGISDLYVRAPTDMLFGAKVDLPALGPRAFERDLDRLFTMDLPLLSYDCYVLLKDHYGFVSSIFNVDMTNFTVTSLKEYPDMLCAAVPQFCGHAKDGHDDRMVYSLLSITDENGVVCYERPYDGATSDVEMDRHAIEFLSGKVDAEASTIIADSKLVSEPMIRLLSDKGFGFVSKCPTNYGDKVKDRIVYSVLTGSMEPSAVRDGWEVYDTDSDIVETDDEGNETVRRLRFVAFRTSADIQVGIDYLREQGRKEAESRFAGYGSRRFDCEDDARNAILETLKRHTGSAYIPEWTVVEVEVNKGYGHKGRPKKDEKPTIKKEYAVRVDLVFDEKRAKRLAEEREIRVLITNLPRSNGKKDNLREGATADGILLSYLGQYKIEHTFRLEKSGMGMDRVYIHTPSRENAMMFVITIATMLSDVVAHVLGTKGVKRTMESLSGQLTTLDVVRDTVTGDIWLDGIEEHIDLFMEILERLGLDPDRLLG